ncbi:MAG TPA: ABC transporter permease [Candidatus Ozemobacteraceae bacterium]|nr:ABC transporter permease [Candidatus Ozemobacteraceae bacterium]
MKASLRRLLRLLRKELAQTLRDPKMLGIIFFMPVLQLFIFGYAVTTDINNIQTAVLDEDHSSASRDFLERLRGSGYFTIKRLLSRPSECDEVLDRAEVQFVLRLPQGFARDLEAGTTTVVQTLFDGTDSMSAGIINGYVNQIIQEHAQQYLQRRLMRLKASLPSLPAVRAQIRVWFNPELKSVMFNVPGVLCLILFLVTMIMTALSIVKEKEIGTLEQIIVTPIRPWELILGKTIPYFLIGLIVTCLVISYAALARAARPIALPK